MNGVVIFVLFTSAISCIVTVLLWSSADWTYHCECNTTLNFCCIQKYLQASLSTPRLCAVLHKCLQLPDFGTIHAGCTI